MSRPSLATLLVGLVSLALVACNGNTTNAPDATNANGPFTPRTADRTEPGSVPDIAEEARLSVVRVGVNCREGDPDRCAGAGSGWAVDDSGHIVTNSHVISGGSPAGAVASNILVTTDDGRTFEARVVGRDPRTDLAVLRVDGLELDPLPLANLDDLRIGEPVIAIGYAFDLGASPSVTTGVISARERNIQEAQAAIFGLIQTDAAINPGNSGGPLLNLRGEVVGVNTAGLLQAQNIGFAVGADTVRVVVEEILRNGDVVRGFIGIAFQDLTPSLARKLNVAVEDGVLIQQVVPGGPADAAGLREGDVITSLAGRDVAGSSDLPLVLIGLHPGEQVELRYYRGQDQRETTITLAEPPAP
jgi:serine protease Do